MLVFILSKGVNFPEHFLLKPWCCIIIWFIAIYPTGKCYPFLVLRKWYLAEHCFVCLTGEDYLFGDLWHFSSPHNHIENLQDISEYSTFSCLIPRLVSPTHYLIHTKTHIDIHTHRDMCSDHRHTHRYTDTQRDSYTQIHTQRDTQRHKHIKTQRHADTGTRTDTQIDAHTHRCQTQIQFKIGQKGQNYEGKLLEKSHWHLKVSNIQSRQETGYKCYEEILICKKYQGSWHTMFVVLNNKNRALETCVLRLF